MTTHLGVDVDATQPSSTLVEIRRDAAGPAAARIRKSATGPSPLLRLRPVLFLTLVQGLIALDLDLPVARPLLALVTLLGIPTLVLYRRARLTSDTPAARLLYAFGLSLLGVILVALLLNTALPILGVQHPLQPMVLAAAWLVIDVALLGWRAGVPLLSPRPAREAARAALRARWEPAQALAVGAVLAAVVGAVRLNNGAGGGVAITAHVVAAASLLTLLLGRRVTVKRDLRVLGLAATSLLFATSLRGWHITGHDIQAEFLAFQLTNDGQHWQMGALQNAYNACLSVNILPTVIVQTTGLSGEFVFKALLQLVFALVPVLTYLLSRRFVSRRLALVAAIFTMAFPTFFTDMPYLVRQEIAFFFLALLLALATDPAATRRWQRWLVTLFGVGVILSHYSTTYVMLIGLVFALLAAALAKPARRLIHRGPAQSPGGRMVLVSPVVVLVLTALTWAWAGPITHTGGHASAVARETIAALTGDGLDGPGSSDASYWLFSRDDTTPRQRMDLLVEETLRYRADEIPAGERLVRHPGEAELRPELFEADTAPLTALGERLDAIGIAPATVEKAAKLGSALLMQLFLLLGLVWLVGRRGKPRPTTQPEAPEPSREIACLSIGAVTALAVIVLIPNLSVDYGVLRAFQQTLLVIAPLMAVGLWLCLRPLGSRVAAVTTAAVPVLLLLVLSGVAPALLGGQLERLALANSGPYYDRLYASDSEAQAIEWLAAADRADTSNARVIANRNVNVRLLAATANQAPVADRLFPTLLTKGSYVFVDEQIIEKGTSTVFYTGDLLTYAYPIEDLNQRLDLVYSSPRSRIYR